MPAFVVNTKPREPLCLVASPSVAMIIFEVVFIVYYISSTGMIQLICSKYWDIWSGCDLTYWTKDNFGVASSRGGSAG